MSNETGNVFACTFIVSTFTYEMFPADNTTGRQDTTFQHQIQVSQYIIIHASYMHVSTHAHSRAARFLTPGRVYHCSEFVANDALINVRHNLLYNNLPEPLIM